jgi:hypothetical protein
MSTTTNEVARVPDDAEPMTTPILTERDRLTALRAAALFDGTSSTLIRLIADRQTVVGLTLGVLPAQGLSP